MALHPLTPASRENSSLETSSPVLDWIDRELVDTYSATCGYGGNALLELRQAFRQNSPNVFVGKFYRLLPKIESTHFLLSYRIRHWLALHFEIAASDPLARVAEQTFPFNRNQNALPEVRNHFFEHAEKAIPLTDIRVQIRKKS